MSRILEFQPADEQTVVARVLLELHQSIDAYFPEAKGTSRQFTKTVLSSGAEATAVDQQPSLPHEVGGEVMAGSKPKPAKSSVNQIRSNQIDTSNRSLSSTGIEFSKVDPGQFAAITATSLEESTWSIWLTRILILMLIVGAVLLAWIYLFGMPI